MKGWKLLGNSGSGVPRPIGNFKMNPMAAESDLIVEDGKIVKNRWGGEGTKVPIPDGMYRLMRLEG